MICRVIIFALLPPLRFFQSPCRHMSCYEEERLLSHEHIVAAAEAPLCLRRFGSLCRWIRRCHIFFILIIYGAMLTLLLVFLRADIIFIIYASARAALTLIFAKARCAMPLHAAMPCHATYYYMPQKSCRQRYAYIMMPPLPLPLLLILLFTPLRCATPLFSPLILRRRHAAIFFSPRASAATMIFAAAAMLPRALIREAALHMPRACRFSRRRQRAAARRCCARSYTKRCYLRIALIRHSEDMAPPR